MAGSEAIGSVSRNPEMKISGPSQYVGENVDYTSLLGPTLASWGKIPLIRFTVELSKGLKEISNAEMPKFVIETIKSYASNNRQKEAQNLVGFFGRQGLNMAIQLGFGKPGIIRTVHLNDVSKKGLRYFDQYAIPEVVAAKTGQKSTVAAGQDVNPANIEDPEKLNEAAAGESVISLRIDPKTCERLLKIFPGPNKNYPYREYFEV